ncbi:MAG: hypothetical protein CM1200mP39_30740 [Dehalococcoidia bacterium]|nr:MAG: hypothetical protein CM1200mP39_30740 [Dehalococcoidia bacterium]
MLERFINRLGELGAEFMRMDDAAQTYDERHPYL